MERPLLALTRGPADAPAPARDAAAENMRQLIQLRWLAVGGQLVAILLAHFGLGVDLPLAPMLVVVAVLAAANLLFTATLRRDWVAPIELLLALLLDMAALTVQLYLSGGATNPFISLYLLQVVLGAILLARSSAWLLAAAAAACFVFLSIRHLPLRYPPRLWDFEANLQLIGQAISFALVAVLLMLFITRISRNLRSRDHYVAQLRQRAVEEDSIVRMGLFASGAAHELGTPLSTLSVLISDWQRTPALAGDPDLREELADAQAEVARCKEIVSNILHSAGTARGEAMGSEAVHHLLDGIVEEWRVVHPDIPLGYSANVGGTARIAAEPALRQAVWNLLENAGEASPGGVDLTADVEDSSLVIAVGDRGPGFAPGQLARIGQLYQSSKGAGHGLGLFLVANVARRLGGTLEAENRSTGGAAVRLLLPLTSTAENKHGA
ncbi:ATP-binding protein [Sphingomonas sp. BN140010]|uniref:histidine kinase n=1 Tax=Sphingomonas arvum TaxID=2992113 RepID=A0ABT3JBA4_9SPHN|nr:ATP-binding protein [Sphingomonas sp. BN140010]MCW3796341.1 ATP-binding protein [Sphingomonas sp. BN140010]